MSSRQQRVMVQPIVRCLQLPNRVLRLTSPCRMSSSRTCNRYALLLPSRPSLTTLLQRQKVVIWLYDNIEMRIEGVIIVRVSMHLDALRVELQDERRRRLLHCTFLRSRDECILPHTLPMLPPCMRHMTDHASFRVSTSS